MESLSSAFEIINSLKAIGASLIGLWLLYLIRADRSRQGGIIGFLLFVFGLLVPLFRFLFKFLSVFSIIFIVLMLSGIRRAFR